MTAAGTGFEARRIADELRRAQEGEAWHGPSAREVLTGLTAEQAAARPIPGAHSIWELVLHLTAWRGEALRRIQGAAPGAPPEGDWPPVRDTGDAAWAAALRALGEANRALVAAVQRLPDSRLDDPIGRASAYVLLHGVAQHDAYHLGQVSLLKKALQARPAPGR